jgi:hypothetical protein
MRSRVQLKRKVFLVDLAGYLLENDFYKIVFTIYYIFHFSITQNNLYSILIEN